MKYAVINKDFVVRAIYNSKPKAVDNASYEDGDMIVLCPDCRTKNSMQANLDMQRNSGRRVIGLIKPEFW